MDIVKYTVFFLIVKRITHENNMIKISDVSALIYRLTDNTRLVLTPLQSVITSEPTEISHKSKNRFAISLNHTNPSRDKNV